MICWTRGYLLVLQTTHQQLTCPTKLLMHILQPCWYSWWSIRFKHAMHSMLVAMCAFFEIQTLRFCDRECLVARCPLLQIHTFLLSVFFWFHWDHSMSIFSTFSFTSNHQWLTNKNLLLSIIINLINLSSINNHYLTTITVHLHYYLLLKAWKPSKAHQIIIKSWNVLLTPKMTAFSFTLTSLASSIPAFFSVISHR